MKAPQCDFKELKYSIFGYGIYLGAIWWNTEGKKNYRWHKRFRIHRLIESRGASFWDKKYW